MRRWIWTKLLRKWSYGHFGSILISWFCFKVDVSRQKTGLKSWIWGAKSLWFLNSVVGSLERRDQLQSWIHLGRVYDCPKNHWLIWLIWFLKRHTNIRVQARFWQRGGNYRCLAFDKGGDNRAFTKARFARQGGDRCRRLGFDRGGVHPKFGSTGGGVVINDITTLNTYA